MDNIKFEKNKDRFLLFLDEKVVGQIEYTEKDNIIYMDHLMINSEFNIADAAKFLIESIVEEARKSNTHLKANCPYAKILFSEHPEFNDVFLKD